MNTYKSKYQYINEGVCLSTGDRIKKLTMEVFLQLVKSVCLAAILLIVNFQTVECEPVEPPKLHTDSIGSKIPTMEVAIRSQKVFRFAFNPNLFGWSNPEAVQGAVTRHMYTYRPSLKGLPDMPYWMRYKYSHRHKAGSINMYSVHR